MICCTPVQARNLELWSIDLVAEREKESEMSPSDYTCRRETTKSHCAAKRIHKSSNYLEGSWSLEIYESFSPITGLHQIDSRPWQMPYSCSLQGES